MSISVVYVRPLAKKSVFKRTDPLDSHLLLLRGSCVSRSHHHPVGLKKDGKEKRESAGESERYIKCEHRKSIFQKRVQVTMATMAGTFHFLQPPQCPTLLLEQQCERT